uniref:Transmembrane protein 130 n=1 Tax=Malurus cyaneus samueli TaxID=2593467 RepID=A0A8C5TPN3_9PASS
MQGFNSVINVTGEFPGTFPVSVWVTHRNCWLCRPVARNTTVLQITEDSRVSTQDSSSSTGTMTRISFSLHDPSHYFKSASFVYNWDFGDGVYQMTKEPFVYCNCSSLGNRTVHLKAVAEWEHTGGILHERETMQKTGDFSTALELLGNSETFCTFNPGPPLALCWLIKAECVPLEGDKCHLVEISGSCYNLSHTFRDAGQYCLSVRVDKGVTMLQTYHGIKVRPAGERIHPAFFVLLCTALVSVMLILVLYTTFRSNTQQKDLVEPGCGPACCRLCFLQPSKEAAWESHELLHSLYKPVKMYTL